jgi:hypothetical protein
MDLWLVDDPCLDSGETAVKHDRAFMAEGGVGQ